MARPSETQEREKISCPVPCGKTILVDGAMKCTRCKRTYCLEELLVERILYGNQTWSEVMRTLGEAASHKEFPFGTDTPFHKELRELFGERFLGIPEFDNTIHIWRKDEIRVKPEYWIPLLSIPYTRERLERAAQSETTWLVFFGTSWNAEEAIYNNGFAFCDCHKEGILESPSRLAPADPGWRLIDTSREDFPLRDQETRPARSLTVAEATYFVNLAERSGRRPLKRHKRVFYRCDGLALGFASIRPYLKWCEAQDKFYVSTNVAKGVTVYEIRPLKVYSPDR